MIKSLSIKRLNSRSNVDINFNKDITIISGPNGCGKTNILKLLWYLVSPNVERAISEINFEEATLCTDEYTLNVSKIEQAATFESGKQRLELKRKIEQMIRQSVFSRYIPEAPCAQNSNTK